jgi:hypothetical protein
MMAELAEVAVDVGFAPEMVQGVVPPQKLTFIPVTSTYV